MATLTYYGHSTVGLEAGGVKILIDPFFTGNPNASAKSADVTANFIVITHAHNDHIGDAVEIAKRCKATVIANYEIAMYLASQGCDISPQHIGGKVDYPFGRVKLTPAFHGSTYETADGKSIALGMPGGAVVSIGGKHVYHAGDTALFSDMKLIAAYADLDVALLPIGDRFTMGPEDAAQAAEWANAKVTVPIHFNTWPLIEVDPKKFAELCGQKGKTAKVMKPGETLEF